MKHTTAQQKTTKSPKALFNLRRQRATAENLAKGMGAQEAMVAAGYSPLYVQHQGYKAIKRPCIQSAFTDSCERIMQKRKMHFDELVEPYFDALTAPLIVKSTQLGDAYMPIEPKSQKPYPDHAIRMDAADRLVGLYGGDMKMHEPDESAFDDSKMPPRVEVILVDAPGGQVQVNVGHARAKPKVHFVG